MKTHSTRLTITLTAFAALFVFSAFAEVSQKAIQKILKGVPALEVPAKAASLVVESKPDEQKATTAIVVKTAIRANASSAAPVVGAIAKAAPKMAAVAAAAAVSLEPKQATKIARAATSGAPEEADNIAVAMNRETSFSLLTPTATEVVSAKDITPTTSTTAAFERAPKTGPKFIPRNTNATEVASTNAAFGPGDRDYSAP
ncbi:MAG: hypothetical protein ABI042_14980 [Verrucomicrobiota bacterium]